jgi:hypothetical protein
MKTKDLNDALLDYWVGRAEGKLHGGHTQYSTSVQIRRRVCYMTIGNCTPKEYSPTQDWQTGGPIVECERICLTFTGTHWEAEPRDQNGVAIITPRPSVNVRGRRPYPTRGRHACVRCDEVRRGGSGV